MARRRFSSSGGDCIFATVGNRRRRIRSAIASWVSGVRLAAILLALGMGGCRTREEGARKAEQEAALAAASACPAAAGDAEVCRDAICRERCANFADSVSLAETCRTKCTGQGTCDSDADCARGLVCVMIAPRLRRCEPSRDAAAGGTP
jgi:hypothetical protein